MIKKSTLSDIEILLDLPIKVDTLLLKDRFSTYRKPTKKIFDLIAKGFLVAIKRGHYLNMKSKSMDSVQPEIIANSLYQPSYITAEWALQYYGLLTDRVYTITSVTTKKSAQFETPLGNFTYDHLTRKRYPVGYLIKISKNSSSFLIARPEKALLDYFNLRLKDVSWSHRNDILETLENDLRLDVHAFLKMIKIKDLQELTPYYHRNSNEARLLRWLLARKDKKHV